MCDALMLSTQDMMPEQALQLCSACSQGLLCTQRSAAVQYHRRLPHLAWLLLRGG